MAKRDIEKSLNPFHLTRWLNFQIGETRNISAGSSLVPIWPLLTDGLCINDTYEVEAFLGEGAFAEVYRVKHRFLGRQAMKFFKTPGWSPGEVSAMLGEAVLLSKINHPNIVRVHDANTASLIGDTFGFFTMDYIAGGSLSQYWRSFGAQFMPLREAIEVMRQVCKGIAVAHSHNPPIIHRDIKPQNILIGHETTGIRARVSDFGLAKNVNPLTLMATSQGTVSFKALEALAARRSWLAIRISRFVISISAHIEMPRRHNLLRSSDAQVDVPGRRRCHKALDRHHPGLARDEECHRYPPRSADSTVAGPSRRQTCSNPFFFVRWTEGHLDVVGWSALRSSRTGD